MDFEMQAADTLAESENRIIELEDARARETELLGMQNTDTL